MMHDFGKSLKRGMAGEAFLDRWFRDAYSIETAGLTIDRCGIDRFMINLRDRTRWSVQFKTDYKATRNAFVEVVSVDHDMDSHEPSDHPKNQPGWPFTCAAQMIVYLVPHFGLAWLIETATLREKIPAWRRRFELRPVLNEGRGSCWRTWGLLVPLTEFATAARRTIEMPAARALVGENPDQRRLIV